MDFPKTFEYSREREFSDFWKNKGLVTITSNGLKSKDSAAEFDRINTVIFVCGGGDDTKNDDVDGDGECCH